MISTIDQELILEVLRRVKVFAGGLVTVTSALKTKISKSEK